MPLYYAMPADVNSYFNIIIFIEIGIGKTFNNNKYFNAIKLVIIRRCVPRLDFNEKRTLN